MNLFLEVRGRRPDGFHEIATFILAVGLFDSLEFHESPGGAMSLRSNRPEFATPDNLVIRAATMLRDRTGCRLGAKVKLIKRIPSEAGLGGGSADGAAALAGLNRLWGLGLSRAELAAMAAGLGSDVPFFFDQPAGWCTGRGETVEPAAVGRRLDLVLVCPPVGVPTGEAYARVKIPEAPETGDRLRAAVASGDVDMIAGSLFNRLSGPAEELRPVIKEIRGRMESTGAAGVLMSGSGSCLFALCRDRGEALRVAHEVRAGGSPGSRGCRVFVTRGYA